MSLSSQAHGYRLVEPGRPLERCGLESLEPAAGQVVVEIAGCGICHTDVGFATGHVPTRMPPPIILGHEICGRVVEAGDGAERWLGETVIVPAVIPCGGCGPCRAGRPTSCRRQFMPGNHGDGGFATHVRVPARGLCPIPEELPDGISAALLSVVADAVTTPLEAIHRSQLAAGDVAVFVGVGGVGGFGVQIAAALGATVAAVDVDRQRLELAGRHGAELLFDASEAGVREIRNALRALADPDGGSGLKIFETSGTPAGQTMAFGLLGPGAHLAIVGFTPEPVELHLSNLMAFDATACGNWGSSPERYPEALALVLEGKVALTPFIEVHPLDSAPEVLADLAAHRLHHRPILVPPPAQADLR